MSSTTDAVTIHEDGPLLPKPIVVAAHGTCNTLGIELLLASQVAIAADDARFAQLEVARGIFPLGGATFRLPARMRPAGMRYPRQRRCRRGRDCVPRTASGGVSGPVRSRRIR